MRGALATAALELRLAIRSPGFWVLQCVLLVSGLLVLINDGPGGPQLRYAASQLRQFVAFNWLLLFLMAWPALQRVNGRRGELPLATQVRSTSLALGTLLGILLWLVPAGLLQLTMRWLLGLAVQGQANWTLLGIAPGPALASALLALGAAACLSLIFRRLLPALLVWLGIWILLLVHAGGPWGGFVGPMMPLFDPFNVFFEGLLLSPSVGLGLMGPLVIHLALLFAAAGVVLLMLWVALLPLTDSRRLDVWAVPRLALLAASVLLAGWAGVGYFSTVRAAQPAGTPELVVVDEWRVIGADASVAFAPAEQVAVNGRLTLSLLPAGGWWPEQLVLRLNSGIGITSAEAGASLDFRRDGDSVIIALPEPVAPAQQLVLTVEFSGTPVWPYSDHRFRHSTTFPALDSAQPITSLAIDGTGFLLRDGDWLPWPWTSRTQTGEEHSRLSVTTADGTGVTTDLFEGDIPALLSMVPPSARNLAGGAVHVGADPGAGLASVLGNLAAVATGALQTFGVQDAPVVVAMPYLRDAYMNESFLAVPEAVDIENRDHLAPAYQRAAPGLLLERAALQVLARAWLNGQLDAPRGYAPARSHTAEMRQAFQADDVPEPRGYRLLEVTSGGASPSGAFPHTWSGTNPAQYDITPFALWLGMELAAEEVRATDAAMLVRPGPSDELFERLRQQHLPVGLVRAGAQFRLLQDLIGWSDRAGGQAVEVFLDVYMASAEQSHDAILAALEAGLAEQLEGGGE